MKYSSAAIITLLVAMTRDLVEAGRKAVGESCAIHTDCVYVAECAANRTCICRDTYVPNPSNNTTCLAGVNNSCDYDEDCIDNAFCLKQSHCECMDGRRPTKDRVTCVYTDKSSLATNLPFCSAAAMVLPVTWLIF